MSLAVPWKSKRFLPHQSILLYAHFSVNRLIELFMHSTAEPEEEQVSGKPSGELLNSLLFFCVCMRTLLLMNTLLSHTLILLHVDDGEL